MLHRRIVLSYAVAPTMDELITLVRTYRLMAGLSERLRLGENIFRRIEPDLRFFVFNSVAQPAADDVLQEVLTAIAVGLRRFAGSSTPEFWAWCYSIARNKLTDHFRSKASDRLQPMPMDELRELIEESAQSAALAPGDRLDLEYAMNLLTQSKPECHDYLWRHFVFGLGYGEIAAEQNLDYDNVRMRIGRCLAEVQALMA